MPLYGVMELHVLFGMPISELQRLILNGKIEPDFIVKTVAGTGYFFHEIPPALAKKGK